MSENNLSDYSTLTQQQFDTEIEKGMASIEQGKTVPASEVRTKMQKKLSL